MLYAKIDNKVSASCDKTMPLACTTFERMKCCLFLNSVTVIMGWGKEKKKQKNQTEL
jgi:hypothetical protein